MGTSSFPSSSSRDQRKLLYQKYGYDINKIIRTHEKLETTITRAKNNNNNDDDDDDDDAYNIINEKSDKLDFQSLLSQEPMDHATGRRRRKKRKEQGFRNFTKVSRSFRHQEDFPSRDLKSTWLLKTLLKYLKYRSRRLDPYITKWFTSNPDSSSSSTEKNTFLLRIVDFGESAPNGDVTAILGDSTHKICAVFPAKTIFDHIAQHGGLPFHNNAYSINNYISISKANCRFSSLEFIKTHFGTKLNYIDSKIRYCVLQVLQFKFMYSVEYLMASRIDGAPPLEQVVNDNGSQYVVYDYEDFDLNVAGGGGKDALPKFDKSELKSVYNNEFYQKLCYLASSER
ncbi:EST3 [Candida theae]|uniref:Telomere replication protein EST3 n=1 Tax=Candida theae TaxID=1198502 RepID=A0AAD5G147_9ASCO|nr:EST3 [Candida theae]KAI5968477.1 EST3 [Candida theae]